MTDHHHHRSEPVATRALVAYASRHGSTEGVAHAIGRAVAGTGASVEVRHVDEVDDVAGHGLVVVGAPIRFDRWMPDAVAFVERHRADLAATPTALFFTCLALAHPAQAGERAADRYEERVRAVAAGIEPVSVGRFAGALDLARLPPVGRAAFRALLALRGAHAGDHRDWDRITSWARDLASADLAGASEGEGSA